MTAGFVGIVTGALRRCLGRCAPPGRTACDDVRAKSALLSLRFFLLFSSLPLSVGIECLPVPCEFLFETI